MILWKFGLNSDSSEHASTSVWSPLPLEVRIAFHVASWWRSSLSGCLRFLRMCHSRLSLGRLCLVMLLGLALAYGLTTSYGDWAYAQGMLPQAPIKERIDNLRIAAKYNPFDHNSRTVGAGFMAAMALMSKDRGWLEAARAEIRYRLETDSTDAVLLARGMMVNLELGDQKEANFYFEQFQRVNKSSPVLKQVSQPKIEGTQNVKN